MYKIEGWVHSEDSDILADADISELKVGGIVQKTKTNQDGKFTMNVASPTSQISVGKDFYITQVMSAKDLNDFIVIRLKYGVVVRTKPKNNNLLYALVAAGIITAVVVATRKTPVKQIRIK